MVTDNFYTRHVLARVLLAFTDSEVRMLGTVRIQLVDKWNKPAVRESIERLEESERGSWELVAAVDVSAEQENFRAVHMHVQSKLPKNQRTSYSGITTFAKMPSTSFSRIRNPVFYRSDLLLTPSARVLDGKSEEAIFAARDYLLCEGGLEASPCITKLL